MSDLISVVIPNYNIGRWITKSIESVINQTYKNIEIIVNIDFSIDNSIEIVKSIDLKGRTIQIIENKNNGFLNQCDEDALMYCQRTAYSRNVGIMSSARKFITTLDFDDIYLNNKK